jgi:hypothetical protein
VAHVVASRLQKDGIDGVVVSSPDGLASRAAGRVDAVVVQDKYPSGEQGKDLLDAIAGDRGIKAVYLMTGDLGNGEEEELRSVGVLSFLRTEATPHSIASAATDAANAAGSAEPGDIDVDIVLHEDEEKNSFDISVDSTAADVRALTFDGHSDEQTVEVAALDLEQLKKNLENVIPSSASSTQLDGAPHTAQDAPANATVKVQIPIPLDGMTIDGGQFDPSQDGPSLDLDLEPKIEDEEQLLDGLSDEFDLPSLPPPKPAVIDELSAPALSAPAPISQADQSPVLDLSEEFSVEDAPLEAPVEPVLPDLPPDEESEAPLAPEATAEEPEPADPPGPAEDEEAQRNEAMQMQELKKALLAQQKARKSAEERVKELESRVAQLEPADAKSSEGVPEEGALEDVRYPVLLSRCRSEGYTGKIELHIGDQAQRTIYLRDGLPVGYSSSEPGERIGKMMVEQGRITDDQYIKASMAMVERGIRLTEAMVELGFIEGEKLAVEMRNLTRDQIIHGFETTQGRFTSVKGATPDDSVATFDFGPGEIYVQGYRKYAPQQEMMSLFESLRDTYLKSGDRLASFRPKLGLTSEDERLIRLLGEAYTVEEAVEKAALDAEHASRILAALQALDLVEEWSPGVEQFRARLKTERQLHAEEIARLREEMSAREKDLFAGFERALSRIGEVTGGGAAQLDMPRPATGAVPSPRASAAIGDINDVGAGVAVQAGNGASVTVAGPPPPTPAGGVSAPSADLSPPPNMSDGDTTMNMPSPNNGAEINLDDDFPGVNVGTAPDPADGPLSPADQKYAEGLEQARQNKLDEAEVTLREAVRMDATKPHYLLSLARVLLENPRYERAGTLPVVRSLLDRAVQIAPDDGDVHALHDQVVSEMGG